MCGISGDVRQSTTTLAYWISAQRATKFLQQRVHDAVLQDTDRAIGTIFVLTAPAGTGKTFCINSILASAGLRNLRVVSCASSGLAASLLGHARTAHALLICR
jgi:ATP-dependent Lon protease